MLFYLNTIQIILAHEILICIKNLLEMWVENFNLIFNYSYIIYFILKIVNKIIFKNKKNKKKMILSSSKLSTSKLSRSQLSSP